MQEVVHVSGIGLARLNLPPSTPDLAPSDLYLFPQMKRDLRGECFASNTVCTYVSMCVYVCMCVCVCVCVCVLCRGVSCGQPPEFYAARITKFVERSRKCVQLN